MDRSFKYVMTDTVKIYIGGRMTYQDLIEFGDVPFKIKSLASKELIPSAGGSEFTFEEHMRKLKKDSYMYQVLKNLKTKFKVDFPVEKKQGKKNRILYQSRILSLDEYLDYLAGEEEALTDKNGEKKTPVTEEISFSKLAVMMMSF